MDASIPVKFPDSITLAWEWKWYTTNEKKEKYILPPTILSQLLTSVRYALKQHRTREIAQFALAQVHKRGHVEMMPQIVLQTMSMLDEKFINNLYF